MNFKHEKILCLSEKKSQSDYLKIVKKTSLDLSGIVDKNQCKISEEKFSTPSLKRSRVSRKSKKIPIITIKPHNIINSISTKDNYGWYQVTVLYGQKYGKQFIILNLLKCIYPHVFTPVMYREKGNRSIFYVDEEIIANRLIKCDEQITTKDGYKLSISVKKGFPENGIEKSGKASQITDSTLIKKLKYVASKRICEETKTLDLTRFHCDPDLVDDYFCALFLSNIFMTIVDFVVDYMPDLKVLKLQKNNLRMSSNLARDISKFSQLQVLYLNDNLIKNLNGLTLLKNINLEEFYFFGNPIRGLELVYKEKYVRYIQNIFPKLLILDGIKIQKPIIAVKLEDNKEKEELPPLIKNCYYNFEVEKIAQQFIQKYFTVYDSDSREPLLSLYHKSAYFSMTLTSITPLPYEFKNIHDYYWLHRNLISMKTVDQRRNLLTRGRLSIITLLSLLPDTYHYLNSFSTDVMIQTNKRMMVSISGCFKEVNTKLKSIFYFSRTFIIAVEAGNFTVFNDQLSLSYPTLRQKLQAANDFFIIVPTPLSLPEIIPSSLNSEVILITTPPKPVIATSTSDISEFESKVHNTPMEKCTYGVNYTSDSQVLDEPIKKCIADVNFIHNSQIHSELIEECASDVYCTSNSHVQEEPIEECASNVNFTFDSQVLGKPMEKCIVGVNLTSNLQVHPEEMDKCTSNINSTSKSQVLTESIVNSKSLTSSASTLEPHITVNNFKEKLTYLREILHNCLSIVEELLNDK